MIQADGDSMEAEAEEEFDTVLMAVGRKALTEEVNAKQAGVNYNPRNKKIIAENEQTNVPNVFAIGDVLEVSVDCVKKTMIRILYIMSLSVHFREDQN